MRRKVIVLGGKTYVISLPSLWIKQHGIKKGDELIITEKGRLIEVATDNTLKNEGITYHLNGFGVLIHRIIHTLYKRGYDEIKVTFDNAEEYSMIEKALENEGASLEILEKGKNFCKLKNVTATVPEEFEALFRKIFLGVQLLLEQGQEYIKEHKPEQLKEIMNLERTNNKLTTLCRRILNKYGYPRHKATNFIYYAIEELEKIADELKYLFRFISQKGKIRLGKGSAELYSELIGYFKIYQSLFYEAKVEELAQLGKIRKTSVVKAYDIIEKGSLEDRVVAHHLIVLFQKVFNLLGPLIIMTTEGKNKD